MFQTINSVIVEVLRGNENLTRLNAGCLNLFFYPEDNLEITLTPGETRYLQTGLKVLPPFGCIAGITSRKIFEDKKLICLFSSVCLDTDFSDEIVLPFQNLGSTDQTLSPGSNFAEMYFIKVSSPLLQITSSGSLEE